MFKNSLLIIFQLEIIKLQKLLIYLINKFKIKLNKVLYQK